MAIKKFFVFMTDDVNDGISYTYDIVEGFRISLFGFACHSLSFAIGPSCVLIGLNYFDAARQ